MFYIQHNMASNPIILVLFLLPLTPPVLSNEPTNAGNMIELGSWLSPKGNTSSWASSSGHFAFGFYPQGDGYAVGIWLVGATESSENNTVVWTANRDDPPLSANSTLQLTVNGLVLQQWGEYQRVLIAAASELPAGSASMLDSGNFVIYGASNVVWQSFQYPTDTMLGGQSFQNQTEAFLHPRTLINRSKLVSSLSKSDHSSGRFILIMDLNSYVLGAIPSNSMGFPEDVYWSTAPEFEPVSGAARSLQLNLNLEGFLCISKSQCMSNYTNHKNKLGNATSIFRATLDVDGNFRLYEHHFVEKGNTKSVVRMLWEALPDECQIKGFCGLNSYCSNVNGMATCSCYPSYIPSQNYNNSNNMFLDCKLNYSKDDCIISADPSMLYDVTYLEHVWWGQFPYLAVPMTMKSCEKSCKEDCDCGGALYTDGSCYKYQLPLKYGRRIPNAPFTALLKVSSSGHVINPNRTISPPEEGQVVVENRSTLMMTLFFTLGPISLICVVFAMCIFFTYKHQVYKYTKLSVSSNMGFIEECSLRSFSFDELEKATDGFTEEVGKGSFGAVYKGTIHESNRRIDVVVKKLEKIDEGEAEFRAEITAIARTHHRNLVKLIGFCIDGSRKLLVYEYVSNGSLSNLLFKAKKHLPWKERLKIALDVAKGVQYLHEECEVRIIHCNIKPRNILMDESWTAKISDFGFARLLKPEHSRTRPRDEGISRYLAPEWQKEASLSVKADIYSFGVVLLEIVCRRRGIEVNVSSPEEVLLSTWVYQCFEAGQLNMLAANNEGEDEDKDVDLKTLERMVKVGLWCVQDDPSMRPSMKNVILMLEGWKGIPVPPSPTILD